MSNILSQYPGPGDPSGQSFGIQRLEWAVDRLGSPDYYLGLAATRAQINNATDTAGATTWGMARTLHFAREDMHGVTLVEGNYYIDTTTNNEVNNGPATFKASIEYPPGNIPVQCQEGTITVAGGANGILTCPNIFIPAGAAFYRRCLVTNAGGVPYRSGILSNYCGPTDGYVKGTGTPNDLTGGGVVTSIGAFNHARAIYPVAICSITRRPSIGIIGDSRDYGTGDFASDASCDVGESARIYGPQFAYTNLGIPSVTLAGFLSQTHTARLQVCNTYCSHVSSGLGVNDILSLSQTAAQVAANRTVFAALFPGKTIIGKSMSPLTNSTDSWATLANQVISGVAANVPTFNGLERAGIAGETFILDVAAALDPGQTGLWPVAFNPYQATGTANFATTDGIHADPVISAVIRRNIAINFISR